MADKYIRDLIITGSQLDDNDYLIVEKGDGSGTMQTSFDNLAASITTKLTTDNLRFVNYDLGNTSHGMFTAYTTQFAPTGASFINVNQFMATIVGSYTSVENVEVPNGWVKLIGFTNPAFKEIIGRTYLNGFAYVKAVSGTGISTDYVGRTFETLFDTYSEDGDSSNSFRINIPVSVPSTARLSIAFMMTFPVTL